MGDEQDFKHFLPRLFELQVSAAPIAIDVEVLFGKLPYAHWHMWPDEERRVIEGFLMAWGRCLLATDPDDDAWDNNHSTTMERYLCVFYMVLEDLTPFLGLWRSTDSVAALRHLAKVAQDYARFSDTFRGGWWTPRASQQVETWLRDPATEARLVEAFFRYESEPSAEEFASAADALRRTHR